MPQTMCLEVTDVLVLTRKHGTDHIYLNLDEDTSRKMYGENYKHWSDASLKVECPKDKYEDVLRTLGVDEYTVIDSQTGTREAKEIE